MLSADGWDAMHWSRVTHMVGDRWRISVIDVSAMTRYEANQAARQWVTDALDGTGAGIQTAVIGAGMSGWTDCRGAHPGGPKM